MSETSLSAATGSVARSSVRKSDPKAVCRRVGVCVMRDFGLDVGCISASSTRPPNPYHPVQVASIQTLLARNERPRADIVIGDRYGTSCAPMVSDIIEDTLRGLGYTVLRNKPYAGGFITEHYGDPTAGFHAVQIEINRALYMDEREYRRSARFEYVRADIGRMIAKLAVETARGIEPMRDAAE
jgi:hypothetical protein